MAPICTGFRHAVARNHSKEPRTATVGFAAGARISETENLNGTTLVVFAPFASSGPNGERVCQASGDSGSFVACSIEGTHETEPLKRTLARKRPQHTLHPLRWGHSMSHSLPIKWLLPYYIIRAKS
eukprot:1185832-Prorocentrum_minimum.AAC.1